MREIVLKHTSGTARRAVRAGDKVGRWCRKHAVIQTWRNRPKIKVEAPKQRLLLKQTTCLRHQRLQQRVEINDTDTTKVTAQTAKGAAKLRNTVKTTEKRQDFGKSIKSQQSSCKEGDGRQK